MKSFLIVFLPCLIFFSCKKEKGEPASYKLPGKLSKEYYHKNADQVRIYHYNKDGTLNRYEYSFDNYITEMKEFRYTNERLASVDLYVKRNNTWKPEQQMILSYNDRRNRLSDIQIIYSEDPDSFDGIVKFPRKYEFSYPDENAARFNKCIIYSKKEGQLHAFIEQLFEYDDKGNITVIDNYNIADGSKIRSHTSLYEYLQQANPKFRLDDLLEFESFFSPNIWFSRTIINQRSGNMDITVREYQFNADNKASSFIQKSTGAVRNFEYYP